MIEDTKQLQEISDEFFFFFLDLKFFFITPYHILRILYIPQRLKHFQ